MCVRMLEYQQQMESLEGECRELRTCLQVGAPSLTLMMMMMMSSS